MTIPYNVFVDQMDAEPKPTFMISLVPSERGSGAVGTRHYDTREAFVDDLKRYLGYTDRAIARFFASEDLHHTLAHFPLTAETAAYLGW
jgi:hypothetical protein